VPFPSARHLLRTAVEDNDHWLQDVSETQEVEVNFPVIADEDGEIHRMVRRTDDRGAAALLWLPPH
jgi:alkyl hydroperoxide reductase subunit AhpC